MTFENSSESENQLPSVDLQPTVDYIVATMRWSADQPDFAERDLVATTELEKESADFPYTLGSQIIGDVQGVDNTNPNEPYLILGNVVHYTESDEHVRTVIATYDIERIPLDNVTEPFLTNHMRKGACVGDSWHKDHFPSTD